MDLPLALLLAVAALAAGLAIGRRMPRPAPGPATRPTRAPAVPATYAPATSDQAPPQPDPASDLIDLVGFGAVRLDDDLLVLTANEAAERLLGRRPGALAGRSAMEAFTDHRIEEIARTAIVEGTATGEIVVRTSAAPVLLVRALRTADGGAWVAFEDVSELRRLQRIRAEFIDNVSHELRTPLTNVSLLTETLVMDAASLPPKAADRVRKIQVETDHLVTMVNELLDLSRIESGTARLVIEDVQLDRLARATIERVGLFAERQGVRLALDAPDSATAPVAVRGDGERLGQALLNLVHNAIKFSPPGTDVTVHVAPAESEVVVAVEDHGPGIPRAALPRVFERFYKVDRARTRERGGTGLGLAITRHIVEAHGGRVWVESVEGAGSTFAFALPLAGPDLAESAGG